jgi:hypothetical protein
MVDIAAAWMRRWTEGDGSNDCILMSLGWTVEMLLGEAEGEKGGYLIVVVEASGADARAGGCNLQVVKDSGWMVRPGRRSREGIKDRSTRESFNCN